MVEGGDSCLVEKGVVGNGSVDLQASAGDDRFFATGDVGHGGDEQRIVDDDDGGTKGQTTLVRVSGKPTLDLMFALICISKFPFRPFVFPATFGHFYCCH